MKYLFFAIFLTCLAGMDAIRDYTDMSDTWRWWWHAIKIFGNVNVWAIFMWHEIRTLKYFQNKFCGYLVRHFWLPSLWLMLMAFGIQVFWYNFIFG